MNPLALARGARRPAWLGLPAYVLRRFQGDDALNMASSLSYTSLLSLVPLLAIALAMLAAFPVFSDVRQQLQEALFAYLVPETGQQMQDYVGTFVGNAGKLTAAGIVGLGFTAVTLLIAIETSLNRIFRVARPRAFVSRLLLYWTALTLGPLLIGTSFSMSAWVFAAGDLAARFGLGWLSGLGGWALPNLLLAVAFTLLFLAVPNRRVSPWHAAAGGLFAALAFAILRLGFGLYLAHSNSYQNIYGAVAMVPITLFWMYLSWAVVLAGAELAAALPEWRLARLGTDRPPGARRRLVLALSLLGALKEAATKGGEGMAPGALIARLAEAEAPTREVLGILIQAGFVVETAAGRLVPGQDFAHVSLGELLRRLDILPLEAEGPDPAESWMAGLAQLLARAEERAAGELATPLSAILAHKSMAGARDSRASAG